MPAVLDRTIAYRYDVFDQRIAKTVQSATYGYTKSQYYARDNGEVVLEYQPGAVDRRHLYAAAVDQLRATDVDLGGDLLYWAVNDDQDSLWGVLRSGEQVVRGFETDVFGNPDGFNASAGTISFSEGQTKVPGTVS